MEQIVCYGDSNTWGFWGSDERRFPFAVRWPGRLQKLLGESYRIVEEGLCSRTLAMGDDVQPYRNGLRYLVPCLMSHYPFSVLIVMLGTNDTKCRYHLSAEEIVLELEEFLRKALDFLRWKDMGGKILLVAPPPIQGNLQDDFEMDETSLDKTRAFSDLFHRTARKYGVDFLDGGKCVTDFQEDGCHFSQKGHEQMAAAVYQKLYELLPVDRKFHQAGEKGLF